MSIEQFTILSSCIALAYVFFIVVYELTIITIYRRIKSTEDKLDFIIHEFGKKDIYTEYIKTNKTNKTNNKRHFSGIIIRNKNKRITNRTITNDK